MPDEFSQEPFRCRLDWGYHGVVRAAHRRNIIILVDTLSFSTATIHAVSQGAIVYPCGEGEDAVAIAQAVNGEIAVSRSKVPAEGKYSLSPQTFDRSPRGTRIVLPSLNGGNCCRLAETAPYLFVAAIINAGAAAKVASGLLMDSDLVVTVIACGEREPQGGPPGELRMAIEDYLGAGAIFSALPFSRSPEARVCAAAFESNRDHLENLILESVSGRELCNLGFGPDVEFASRLNSHDVLPVLLNGELRPYFRSNQTK